MALDTFKVTERKAAILDLKKEKGIDGQKAAVVLCLDYSGSMSGLYANGSVQDTVERILPLGLAFDDNNEVDFYIFENGVTKLPENITLKNLDNYINNKVMNKYSMGGTEYAPAINRIVKDFSKSGMFGSKAIDYPVYVIFITDGDNSDHREAEEAIRNASKHGVFFQFVGIGNTQFDFLAKLDNLSGRQLDNANFFKIPDLRSCDDKHLYNLLMTEFPGWIPQARKAGQIK
jgi:uncharacterized protein with von Willebrand factor type A (vWA) domain